MLEVQKNNHPAAVSKPTSKSRPSRSRQLRSHKPIPPALAQKILLRFLRDDLAEEVLGDLNEKFYSALKTRPPWKAKLDYWYQATNYLRPFAVRKSTPTHSNLYAMYKSYF